MGRRSSDLNQLVLGVDEAIFELGVSCFGNGLALGVDKRRRNAISLCVMSLLCELILVTELSTSFGIDAAGCCFFRKVIEKISFT